MILLAVLHAKLAAIAGRMERPGLHEILVCVCVCVCVCTKCIQNVYQLSTTYTLWIGRVSVGYESLLLIPEDAATNTFKSLPLMLLIP